MNSLLFFAICGVILALSYKFYASAFEKFLGVDPKRPPPSHTKKDGVDFIPAKHWLVLFGHHFSSIAGAGPVIGPIIALSMWGWGPATIFVILGTILIGGIHDMSALFVSVRRDGKSVADLSEEIISKRARIIFSSFVLLALIVVIAVFAFFTAQTFMLEPKIVLPSLGLIPAALIVGLLIYRWKAGLVGPTILGLAGLAGLIFLGDRLPIALPKGQELFLWIVILMGYSFVASVLPVNILLQPRDYLSSYLLFFGIAAGFIGIITARPALNTPFFVGWNSIEGPLWPMLFVTVACGAISGFHSLVSAGTTSKQISSERDIKRIGFGGMAVEALLAVIAIIAVSSGFKAQADLSAVVSKGGPIEAFASGFQNLTRFIFGKSGGLIAIILLNSFILTTLDTAARIARYILQELFDVLDRYLATTLIVLASGFIALTGEWKKIWPVFGAANQLIAGLTLLVVTSWLLSRRKHTKYTLIPALFMLLTTVGALGWQFGKFMKDKDFFLMGVDLTLVMLAFMMAIEVRKNIWKRLTKGGR